MTWESDSTKGRNQAEESRGSRRTSAMRAWIAVGAGALILVLLAVSLATTLVVPNVLQRFTFAQQGKARTDIAAIDSALLEYSLANRGWYPDTLRDLVVPDTNGHTYIKGTSIPRDPWGNEYLYDPPGSEGQRPTVYSLGKDARPGGEGDDADLDNLRLRGDR